MTYETIAVEPGVVTKIALNRPEKRNAINVQMERELVDALRDADRREECRAIILHGRGAVFSAGHDLRESELRRSGSADAPTPAFGVHYLHEEVWNIGTPIIAAVHGYLAPHAINLVTATDLVVAAEGTRFSFEYSRVAPGPTYPLLTFTVGVRKHKEWLLLARAVDAEEAKDAGLVNAVVPAERLLDQAMEWANVIVETVVESAVGNKLSVNKDLDRLGLWELYKLKSRFAPSGS